MLGTKRMISLAASTNLCQKTWSMQFKKKEKRCYWIQQAELGGNFAASQIKSLFAMPAMWIGVWHSHRSSFLIMTKDGALWVLVLIWETQALLFGCWYSSGSWFHPGLSLVAAGIKEVNLLWRPLYFCLFLCPTVISNENNISFLKRGELTLITGFST